MKKPPRSNVIKLQSGFPSTSNDELFDPDKFTTFATKIVDFEWNKKTSKDGPQPTSLESLKGARSWLKIDTDKTEDPKGGEVKSFATTSSDRSSTS